MTERALGIVGGVGPESTRDYYRRLVERWHDRGPADTYPHVVIDGLNSRAAMSAMLGGDLEPAIALFGRSVEALAAAGASLAIIGSVMMHRVFPQVAAVAPIPMLSIIDALVADARRRGFRHLGVLGARPTVEGRFFADPFEAAGLGLARPTRAEREWVHDIYFGELVRGEFRAETRAGLEAVVAGMRERDSIDAVVLAGTELPLILTEPTCAGVLVVDAVGVHVEAALDWLVGGEVA
jgi:aspartate racemase